MSKGFEELLARLADEMTREEARRLLETLPRVLPPAEPSPEVKARLLESVDIDARVQDRFGEHVSEFGRLTDLARTAVLDVLALLERPERWSSGYAEGLTYVHFNAGPGCLQPIPGLVRLERGRAFPFHRHLGREIALVLQGECHDLTSGQLSRPGDVVEMPAGSAHAYRAGDEEDLIFLVILEADIEIVPEEDEA